MENTAHRAVAIVGVGAIMPDAPNAQAFWNNIKGGRYSISEVPKQRWDPAVYFDPDHSAADKTYTKIGGWVREFPWEPVKWRLPLPPRVVDAMDDGQKWAVACTREALEDFGYPKRQFDGDRTAVILGNAMGGEKHYITALRIFFPEFARELDASPSFAALPEAMRQDIERELRDRISKVFPNITEDTMPGELANCIAGRVANLFNFHGPNYIVDAACASAMAAISSAVEGLVENDFDMAVTGGIDHNMGVSSFVKFCKIGALSATGTRPFGEGADGFVMGEGAAIFLMKRLADAEHDRDKIYAVIRGIGGSSDGKGKGITAPNPVGQRFAIERAWKNAGLPPSSATYFEAHGTSTRVGDVVEFQSMTEVLNGNVNGEIALGSVKSNIGHLKASAGAAGLFKLTMALHEKVLPPSLNAERPNPDINFNASPLRVNTRLRPWTVKDGQVRRGGLSAFGFGGTNFHMALEEYVPHMLTGNGKHSVSVSVPESAPSRPGTESDPHATCKAPLRGALVIGAPSPAALAERLRQVHGAAVAGQAPAPAAPAESDLKAQERIAIDYADAADLADKASKALKALAANQAPVWKALRAQGIFRGSGPAPKVAFLYTGQGSQYVNMMKPLRAIEPIVAETFAEADGIMKPLLGKPLSEFIFVDKADPEAVAQAERELMQTAITQPAVLATDLALTRMLASYGIEPDMTMGHSLGEYGALVASGCMPFGDALEAVSARGREMTRVAMEDNGKMAAVFAPIGEVERILKTTDGYVVIANVNSENQAVIGGASRAVEKASEALLNAGYNVVPLTVSHAFHTSIVAPASKPLRKMLERLTVRSPRIPIVANVNGEFYPSGPGVETQMLDILEQQIASPVQFVKGLRTLYDAGARVFIEVGPKKALQGFAEDVLGGKGDVLSLFTNHPKIGDVVSFNQALCGLYSAGLGRGHDAAQREAPVRAAVSTPAVPVAKAVPPPPPAPPAVSGDRYQALGHYFAEVLERGWQMYGGERRAPSQEPVAITGAGVGLPGVERVFDDANVARILRGEQFIDVIPTKYRRAIVDKHITRLVKTDKGDPKFEYIDNVADSIKLAGRSQALDLNKEFGVPADRVAALDHCTKLAIGAGLDAMRDAGIPLLLHYKTTSRATQLPDRWGLPDAMRDDTGVIFASVFPGYDALTDEVTRYSEDRARREQLEMLETLRARLQGNGHTPLGQEIDRKMAELRAAIEQNPYVFDRRFMFRILSMGHSQFAEFIGARGPNTHVNAACASTTHAVSVAEDWIRAGRCRRVIIVSADDITTDHLMEWFGAGFLATGAAATDEVVEEAAIPFDRRRHGMIIGMGAAGIVVESAEAARERGIRPICEVLSAVTANSAFHGTRLDVNHICQVMEGLVAKAEANAGVSRRQIAENAMFMSHETYTPARGGSASAEVNALRRVFGDSADRIVIANTKGFTGHAMGAGIEDVVAIKALETGCVPPVANFKEVDPELGLLNLSKGGSYPVEYAVRLGAGFGSQIAMTLLRRIPAPDGLRAAPSALGYAYRIADPQAWGDWMTRMTGQAGAELEVVHRTLRVRDKGAPKRVAASAEHRASPPPPAPVVTPEAPFVAAPPPAPVAPPSPALAQTTAQAGDDPVKERILALVVEKTGYPKEMLDVDLDLEADLGVDTVKQAELFAAIREAYGIERDDNIRLRDFPTLAHVIRFVHDRRPDLAAKPTAPVAAPVPASDPVKERILTLVVEKTGYPKEMLDVDLDLEADLGVDTVKQAELFASIREAYGIERDDNIRLRDFPTLAHVIRFVRERRPDLAAEATATPAPHPAVAPPTPAAADPVAERILTLVVEKTGYPKEMLDLDLDLEADLGVDTVKQAELFASIREAYGIERDDTIKLRDYPTLAHVIRFVRERRPDLAAAAQPAPEPPTAAPVAAPAAADPVTERILDLVVEKTGYPKEMLDLDLDLEADLGVDTVKQAELFALIRESYGIERDDAIKLRDYPTLAHVIRFVRERRPDLAATAQPVSEPPSAAVAAAPAAGSIIERILDLVVEKTGYPKDMLDLDLDLEADLGVDTVKQAELFASIREAYGIERDDTIKLRDYPTLRHVIQFVEQRQPAVAVSAPPPSTAAPAPADEVTEHILDLVVEKTGYPKDMLDLDLDLEADLGVDTVKQAELFASIREAYGIERDDTIKLRDYPTLRHVIQFVEQRKPGAAAAFRKHSDGSSQPVQPRPASFEAANRMPRRVPVPTVRPPLAICKSSGVVLEPGIRVVLMPDRGGAGAQLASLLNAMGVDVLMLDPESDADTLTQKLQEYQSSGPVHGVYWLPALDDEGDLATMDLAAWRESLRVRVKSLYTTMRALYEHIARQDTFLISATRLGGRHGYGAVPAAAPMGGSVTGFTKTYKRERPDALVKAVDFETARNAEDIAGTIIDETLTDPGAVEIGYANDLRWTVTIEDQPADDGQPGMVLNNESVFVVTGAAGSIVSAITADLAAASGGTFYLLDLVAEPDPADPDIVRFTADKDGLKRELFARLQASGQRATPALVEKELARIERSVAARTAIDAVRNARGTAHWFSVNLTNAEAVSAAIAQVREKSGHIDVLLHAAGMERSHFLPDKDPREFDLVFDVKSDGWFNLLHAIGDMPLGATVAFSSIAGRFGNGGQADYSSANDLLCKIASNFRMSRPDTRAIAIDWTAWGGIGMASRGSIPKMMEMAGIEMLPPEAGIPLIRRELVSGGTRGEIVVAGRLGILLNEADPAGGIDAEAVEKYKVPAPMVGTVKSASVHGGVTIETTLDPKVQPFLFDHQIEGTPVLPGVMGLEAFAEAALAILPDWHVAAIEDVTFAAPFKFYRSEPRPLTVHVNLRPDGDDVIADCRLTGSRILPNSAEPQIITHFTGQVRLAKGALANASIPIAIDPPPEYALDSADIYRVYFHGPAYQVVSAAWRQGSNMIARMAGPLPPNNVPEDARTIMAPRLIELCFQAAGLWDMTEHHRLGLPYRIDRLVTWSDVVPGEREVYAIVTPDANSECFAVDVVDKDGNRYVSVAGYRMVTFQEGIVFEHSAPVAAVTGD